MCQKTEGRVLNTFVPVRKGECHTMCGFDRPIMLRTGFPPRLAGTVWKGRVGFQMPFASSTHRKTRCSSDWQESEVLGHVSLTDRVGPGTLKARPLARRFADASLMLACRRTASHLILLPASWNHESAEAQEGAKSPRISLS